jgi:hypothetical protein
MLKPINLILSLYAMLFILVATLVLNACFDTSTGESKECQKAKSIYAAAQVGVTSAQAIYNAAVLTMNQVCDSISTEKKLTAIEACNKAKNVAKTTEIALTAANAVLTNAKPILDAACSASQK